MCRELARPALLGRQPYTAPDFYIRYQNRILFGVDMPITPEIYRRHFRFLVTQDEYFDYPDYIGRLGNPCCYCFASIPGTQRMAFS